MTPAGQASSLVRPAEEGQTTVRCAAQVPPRRISLPAPRDPREVLPAASIPNRCRHGRWREAEAGQSRSGERGEDGLPTPSEECRSAVRSASVRPERPRGPTPRCRPAGVPAGAAGSGGPDSAVTDEPDPPSRTVCRPSKTTSRSPPAESVVHSRVHRLRRQEGQVPVDVTVIQPTMREATLCAGLKCPETNGPRGGEAHRTLSRPRMRAHGAAPSGTELLWNPRSHAWVMDRCRALLAETMQGAGARRPRGAPRQPLGVSPHGVFADERPPLPLIVQACLHGIIACSSSLWMMRGVRS